MRKPSKKQEPLAREEWDFSKVPEAELEACFTWEFAREWEESAEALRHWENESDKDPNKEGMIDVVTGIKNARALLGSWHLLESPWQVLEAHHRAGVLSFTQSPLEQIAEIDEFTQRQLSWNYQHRGSGRHAVAFTVDWSASDTRLLEEFSAWLSRARKAKPVESRGSSRRDHLRMLGAMRLLHHCTFEAAQTLSARYLKAPLYGIRQSWERARRGAVLAFREDFLWDPYIPPALPRSYSKLKASG